MFSLPCPPTQYAADRWGLLPQVSLQLHIFFASITKKKFPRLMASMWTFNITCHVLAHFTDDTFRLAALSQFNRISHYLNISPPQKPKHRWLHQSRTLTHAQKNQVYSQWVGFGRKTAVRKRDDLKFWYDMCNSLGLAQRPAHLSAAQSCSCVVRVVVEQPRAVASGVLAQSRQTLIIPQRPQQVTARAATLLQSLKTFSITHSLR